MSKKSLRLQKIDKELQQIIANYLLTSGKLLTHLMITITRVIAAADLRQARVYFSAFPTPKEVDLTHICESLQNLAPQLQHEISKRLKTKFVPKLTFYPDDNLEHQFKINKILDVIKEDVTKEDVAKEGVAKEDVAEKDTAK